jgi:AraC-like DNA-binding protein
MKSSSENDDVKPDKPAYWQQLRDSPVVRELQAAFTCATGLPLCLLPPSETMKPAGRREPNSALHVRGCMGDCSGPLCQQSLLRAEKKAATSAQAIRFECPAGLLKILVPVVISDQHVASVLVGPFTLRKLNGAVLHRLVGRLEHWNVRGQSRQLRTSWKFGAVLTPAQCDAATKLARMFVNYLAECGDRLLPGGQVSSLLRMIEDTLAKDPDAPVSLKELSDRVQLSPCHFSKVFKEQTGLTFTEYRTRLRIGRAKKLLLDPRHKISDIAFDVGFNSLSRFNQAFRQLTGCSPSKYRSNVRASN